MLRRLVGYSSDTHVRALTPALSRRCSSAAKSSDRCAANRFVAERRSKPASCSLVRLACQAASMLPQLSNKARRRAGPIPSTLLKPTQYANSSTVSLPSH